MALGIAQAWTRWAEDPNATDFNPDIHKFLPKPSFVSVVEDCFKQLWCGIFEVKCLVAEWIHFTLFGIILLTIKLKVYTLGAYELSN